MDKQLILQKYVGDMHALETHIQTAIDKQVKLAAGDPTTKSKLDEISGTLNGHLSSLEQRLEALGGSLTHPVKEAGAAVLGAAAGLIDKVRAEELSKDLRDDYTALNLGIISYIMLNTTAVALGDQETADLSQRNAKDLADFVIWINNAMPRIVFNDLEDSASLDPGAVEASMAAVKAIWRM